MPSRVLPTIHFSHAIMKNLNNIFKDLCFLVTFLTGDLPLGDSLCHFTKSKGQTAYEECDSKAKIFDYVIVCKGFLIVVENCMVGRLDLVTLFPVKK